MGEWAGQMDVWVVNGWVERTAGRRRRVRVAVTPASSRPARAKQGLTCSVVPSAWTQDFVTDLTCHEDAWV